MKHFQGDNVNQYSLADLPIDTSEKNPHTMYVF